jgi:hypothetical protein
VESKVESKAKREELLDAYGEPLLKVAIQRASAGDSSSLRLLLERLLPVAKSAGVTINNNTVSNTLNVSGASFQALQSGLLQISRNHPAARAEIVALLRSLAEPEPPTAPLIEAEVAQ